MKILGIIPARSWSKWVIDKNIKYLNWKPLIYRTIKESLKSKYIDKLIVSTDSFEIAKLAKDYWAEIPFIRPSEISKDTSLDIEFIEHALLELEKNGYKPDIILRLPPTSPLRTVKHINVWIEKLIEDRSLDSVRPITEVQKHPYKMWKISNNKRTIDPLFSYNDTGIKESYNMPRQLLPTFFVQSWAMDVIRYETIKKYKSTSGKKIWYFIMEPEVSINIDSEADFILAEILLKKRKYI